MRKTLFHGIRALLVIAALGLGLQAHADVKIGFIGTFSGPAAALGQDQYDGFTLALEQLDGKLGGTTVKLFKEDDQLKPDIGVQAVRKLIERDDVDLITGVTFSNVMMTIAKPLADADMLFVGSNAGPSLLAGEQCNQNFFFTSWQNDNLAEVMGQYATDQGFKSVYLMAPNYQSGKDQLTGFKRYYKGTISDEVYTQLNQLDYSAEISMLRAEQPDAIYVFYPGGMGINFVKQLHQSGMLGNVPLLSSSIDGTSLPALQDSALGVLASSAWGPDLDHPANQTFVAAFEEKYGRIPSLYAAQAYDAARLIDSALRKTNGDVSDKKALRNAIRAADFDSVRGKFAFNINGFPIQDMRVFEVVKDAKDRVSLQTIATPLKDLHDSYSSQCKAVEQDRA